MRKRVAVAVAAVAMSVMMAVPAFAGTWKYMEETGKWKYQRGSNKYAYNEWITEDDKTYYVDNQGIMQTGWLKLDDQWYYLDETGVRQTGWMKYDNKWYYLYPEGAMAVNTVIDGRTIDAEGVWTPAEGDTEPSNTLDLSSRQYVQNMENLSKEGYTIIASGKTGTGARWENAIRLKGKGSYVKCMPAGEYRLLAGSLAPSVQFVSGIMAKVTVYGDNDQVLYTSRDIHYNEKIQPFGVDVTGQQQLRIEVSMITENFYDDPIILFDKLSLYK